MESTGYTRSVVHCVGGLRVWPIDRCSNKDVGRSERKTPTLCVRSRRSYRAWFLRFARHMTETQKRFRRRSWLQVLSWLLEMLVQEKHIGLICAWNMDETSVRLVLSPSKTWSYPGKPATAVPEDKAGFTATVAIPAVHGEPIFIQMCVKGKTDRVHPVQGHTHTHCR